jgi:MFS transporter, CP family, cyanate transporter
MTLFFGLQSMQAYIVIGWTAQYLRDEGMAASTAGLLVGLNGLIGIPLGALVPSGTVRQHWQRPMLAGFVVCYLAGWTGLLLAPLTATWLWMTLLAIAMATFPMILALISLRGRTPESVGALSTFSQGWGYAIAGVGPLLVGLLRGATGGYTGMFVLVYAVVALLAVVGWYVCRERFVDDELAGLPAAPVGTPDPEIEVAGAEPPVSVQPRP